VPASNVKKAIAQILLEEGYITKYDIVEDNMQDVIKITLKYAAKKPVITGIKRISKPGLRVYANCEKLPKVLGGIGIAVISTSQGIMTDKKARQSGIGGEVLAYVW
jgi:small subunit ribosomal protein S8